MQEVFNTPEIGYPTEWRYDGMGTIDGQMCHIYVARQFLPGRDTILVSSVNAPYCELR